MLIDDGLLRLEGGAWRAVEDLADVTVPPTIHLLLAARLDRLDAEERARDRARRRRGQGVPLRRGRRRSAPRPRRPQVRSRLLALARKELIRPDRAEFAGEDAFRFRHLLIRDAAYEAMPKEQRAELHERFAGWLGAPPATGWPSTRRSSRHHLEQAYRYRAELGAPDDRARELAARAAEHLYAAAVRADERGDLATARSLLERNVELSDGTTPACRLLVRCRSSSRSSASTRRRTRPRSARSRPPMPSAIAASALRAELVRILNRGSIDPDAHDGRWAAARSRTCSPRRSDSATPDLRDRASSRWP